MYGNYANCCEPGSVRRFVTRAERKTWLEDYQKELESELQAVKERIQDLSRS